MKKFNSNLNSVFARDNQTVAAVQEATNAGFITQELLYVDVEQLYSGKYQPRKDFAQDLLEELAASIKKQGILQPIIVRAGQGKHRYEIVAGERRWRAAQLAQLKQVPILVSVINNIDAVAFGLLENIQRADLNPIEEAMAYKRLIEEFALSHNEISERVGKSRSSISNILRLLELSTVARELLIAGEISVGHAKVLLSLNQSDTALVAQYAHNVRAKNLTVRQLEQLIKEPVQCAPPSKDHKTKELAALSRQLADLTGLKSKVSLDATDGGVVKLYFKNRTQLSDLCSLLKASYEEEGTP